ncbi:glycerate kinase [Thalassomonas sp. M1454]|uniref:glycerate kinase n=1 Tax=Thalassomonas sp. M1454 TaxID=2594477 RepID=UPI00117CD882|nr:glycerate kinase [Thalassomonas sp. M1454]TRX57913.1 glycerate kinase [Thalassomonas sp. M1454]
MKIVIAPDSFKESLTALEVANAIELGFKQVFPSATYVKLPMADGGEGTVQAMVDATKGTIIELEVSAPLHNKVTGFYGVLGDGVTAVIEMAAASGLHLVERSKRDPLLTCSFGTGELINHAINSGIKHIIIGLGGSATNDGGSGMLRALGVKLLDTNQADIPVGGGGLSQLNNIDLSNFNPLLSQVKFSIACDVDNPLCGKYGASQIFGPQKGATEQTIKTLDDNLNIFGQKLEQASGKSIINIPGSGAAGGMGAALLACLNSTLTPGIEIVTSALNLSSHVKDADLVITGEGRIDSQTVFGKTPVGVAKIAKQNQCKVIALAGSLADDYSVVHDHGIDAAFSVIPRIMDIDEALISGHENLVTSARNIASLLTFAEKN